MQVDVVGDVQQVRHHHLRHGHGAVGRDVGDDNATLMGGIHVHYVVARGRYAYVSEGGQGIQDAFRYQHLVREQYLRSRSPA